MGSKKKNRDRNAGSRNQTPSKNNGRKDEEAQQEQQDEVEVKAEAQEFQGVGEVGPGELAAPARSSGRREEKAEEAEEAKEEDPEDLSQDPELIKRREAEKREELENDYHGQLVVKDNKISELEKKVQTTEKQLSTLKTNTAQDRKKVYDQEQEVKKLKKDLENKVQMEQMLRESSKVDQANVDYAQGQVKKFQQQKAEMFREKKQALGELAEARAINAELHHQIDALQEQVNAHTEALNADGNTRATIQEIHDMLEKTFTEVKSEELSTPEFVKKISEHHAALKLKRTDSHSNMAGGDEEKTRAPRTSIAAELENVGADSDGGSDASGDIDAPLTYAKLEKLNSDKFAQIQKLNKELNAARRRARDLEWQVKKAEKSSNADDLKRIEKLTEELERERERKTQLETQLETSTTATVVDVPPAPPAPAPPTTITHTVYVARKPSAGDVWESVPWWVLALLLLSGILLAYLWATVWRERALWLGANDAARLGAVRVAMRHQEMACAPLGGKEGLWSPVWWWVHGKLGLPRPRLLT